MADPSGSRSPRTSPIYIPGSETPTPGAYRGHQLAQSASGASWEEGGQSSGPSSYFPPYSPRPQHQSRQDSPGRHPGGRQPGSRPHRSVSASGSQRRYPMNRSASTASYVSRRGEEEDEILSEADEDGLEGAQGDVEDLQMPPDEETPEADDEEVAERLESLGEDDPVTLRERQSLINVEHPFGLPIWKPALYKKSRTVTRNAETAIHSLPSPERHITPGNIFWAVVFGWWLSSACFALAALLIFVPFGGRRYAWLVGGLGWYIFWPFGKYVEGSLEQDADAEREWARLRDEENSESTERGRRTSGGSESGGTVRGLAHSPSPVMEEIETDQFVMPSQPEPNVTPPTPSVAVTSSPTQHEQESSWIPPDEHSSLLRPGPAPQENDGSLTTSTSSSTTPRASKVKAYGTIPKRAPPPSYPLTASPRDILGRILYWILFPILIAPLLLIVCVICFGMVLPIPMAKLNWALLKLMLIRPLSIRFCSAPSVIVPAPSDAPTEPPTIKATRLRAGQAAPSGAPRSTVLLCTYRAAGLQYYKYTIGGVNILFVNLMPWVFFVIFDAFVLLPLSERQENPSPFLRFIAGRALIFIFSLLSVIPLSYFIGMAVASISAQSSIGMGAVINATFGSIIEIILYAIALSQGKGLLVEGSIVGSLLAGVLLMPGASMCSGALRRKEQRFNAKSAGVTSTMLIMAIIGTLTPTMFYQTYGNFQLTCTGCPADFPGSPPGEPTACKHCYYEHPNPVTDPFYQETVKSLMYYCASILLLSYLIGLWFSLRTHASQIWQNPQQLMQPLDLPSQGHPASGRMLSAYHKLVNQQLSKSPLPTHRTGNLSRKPSNAGTIHSLFGTQQAPAIPSTLNTPRIPPSHHQSPSSPVMRRAHTHAHSVPNGGPGPGYGPLIDTVNQAVKSSANANFQPMPLPPNLTTDDFTRAVAVATVSALRHQQAQSPPRPRTSMGHHDEAAAHEGPSWSRTVSACVLMGCTVLYALIAEVLVSVVDVVLEGSGIDAKFLGLTLFALVPNTTEFMNAMSFAINGNIALSMEIGSAYALQVCLLQIPAMVAFSAWYEPHKFGDVGETFTLIFPRWDVIAIILAIFLLTYVYIEARSNYHRGSTLILSYLVLILGFYFAPPRPMDASTTWPLEAVRVLAQAPVSGTWTEWANTLVLSLRRR